MYKGVTQTVNGCHCLSTGLEPDGSFCFNVILKNSLLTWVASYWKMLTCSYNSAYVPSTAQNISPHHVMSYCGGAPPFPIVPFPPFKNVSLLVPTWFWRTAKIARWYLGEYEGCLKAVTCYWANIVCLITHCEQAHCTGGRSTHSSKILGASS